MRHLIKDCGRKSKFMTPTKIQKSLTCKNGHMILPLDQLANCSTPICGVCMGVSIQGAVKGTTQAGKSRYWKNRVWLQSEKLLVCQNHVPLCFLYPISEFIRRHLIKECRKLRKVIRYRMGKEKTPATSKLIQFCYSFCGAVWVSAYSMHFGRDT